MIQLLRLEKVTVPGAARDSPCANRPQNIAKNKPRNQKPQPNMMVSGDTCKMSLKQTSKNAIFCHMCHPLDYEIEITITQRKQFYQLLCYPIPETATTKTAIGFALLFSFTFLLFHQGLAWLPSRWFEALKMLAASKKTWVISWYPTIINKVTLIKTQKHLEVISNGTNILYASSEPWLLPHPTVERNPAITSWCDENPGYL